MADGIKTIEGGFKIFDQNLDSKLIVEKIVARKARVEMLEMIDQATGEVYCAWIENGEWVKIKSSCDDLNDNNDSTFAPEGASEDTATPSQRLWRARKKTMGRRIPF